MSNVVEKLATEVARVAALRERYRALGAQEGVNVAPAVVLMEQSLRNAQEAAGSGGIERIIAAIKDLEGFEE